mmetsp:Transcript_105337/g.178009  ORF Transcript_105337/g.178009 Transcript_105337/m.178009 type:complete len:212 (-) Transcript_105337:367-1002(-)
MSSAPMPAPCFSLFPVPWQWRARIPLAAAAACSEFCPEHCVGSPAASGPGSLFSDPEHYSPQYHRCASHHHWHASVQSAGEHPCTVPEKRTVSVCHEHILRRLFLGQGRRTIQCLHLRIGQAPAQGPKVFTDLCRASGSDDWHCSFAHAPIERNLRHGLVALLSNGLKLANEVCSSWQYLADKQSPRPIGKANARSCGDHLPSIFTQCVLP